MRKLDLLFIISLLFTVSFYAQKKEASVKKVPVSIYTMNSFIEDPNNFSALNKRLNLTSYEFVIVSSQDIDSNMATVDFKNIGKKPSAFIFDDYNRYQNNNLLKGFSLKNDPTRWNLQCIENRIQPYFLNQ